MRRGIPNLVRATKHCVQTPSYCWEKIAAMSKVTQICNNNHTQIKEKIVKSSNFITPDWVLWNFYLAAEVVSHFQWCKRYPCFISNLKIPAITTLFVWGDVRLKSRDKTSHLASTTCIFPLGIILSQPYPTLSFVYILRWSFFGSKQPTLSKAQQNTPDLFTAVLASAMISTRTGHWHYTHLDDCRDARSCLRQHLSCVLSCKRVPEPRWNHCLRLCHCRTLSQCCRTPQGRNHHSLVQIWLLCSHRGQPKNRAENWE